VARSRHNDTHVRRSQGTERARQSWRAFPKPRSPASSAIQPARWPKRSTGQRTWSSPPSTTSCTTTWAA